MIANEELKKWMDSIPYGKYNEVRLRVINDCKINPYTYGNWRNGTCTIPPLAQEKIELIADELAAQGIGYKIIFTNK